ncbi:MAG: S-layer family protein, partial [Armatimonadetes bacterium]|nr:S-layer family protein [Armatimonadota bacterium]
ADNSIEIANTGALNLNDITSLGYSVFNTTGAVDISAASPLTVNADVTAGSDITLTAGEIAGAGDDLTVNANITSIGGSIALNAGDNIAQSTGTLIETQAAGETITLTANAGALDAIGGITQTGTAAIHTNDGNVTMTALDTINVNSVVAGAGTITITSTAGAIEETVNDAAIDLAGAVIDLNASTGIGTTVSAPIEISGQTISADTTNGNVNLANTSGAAATATSLTTGVGDITFAQTGDGPLTVTLATTGTGNIVISNAGILTVTTATAGTSGAGAGNGNITLTTTGANSNNISVGAITALADTVTITSAGSIEESGADAAADIVAATIDLNASTGVGTLATLEITGTTISIDSSGSGAIDVDSLATGPVLVTSLTTGTAGGSIESGTITFDQTGGFSLTVTTASTQQGSIAISNDAVLTVTTATAGSATGSSVSNIVLLTTAGNINVDSVTALDDTVTVTSAGSIEELGADAAADIVGGTLDLNAVTGVGTAATLEITGTTISIDTTVGAIDVDSLATGNVTATSLTTGLGPITFDQTGGFELTVDNASTTLGGTITITNAGAAMTVTAATAGSAAAAAPGDILLVTTGAGNNLNIGSLSALGDTVTLLSGGAITDAITAPVDATNVAALNLIMVATTGIGAAGDLDIDTIVSNLEASGGTGGVFVSNTGDLTIGGLTALVGVSATGSNIVVTTVGSLTVGVGEVVTNTGGGNITLTTTDSGGAADNVLLLAEVIAAGGDGNITITADDNFVQIDNILAAGSGDITVTAVNGSITMSPFPLTVPPATVPTSLGTTQTSTGTGTITYINGGGNMLISVFSTAGNVVLISAGSIVDINDPAGTPPGVCATENVIAGGNALMVATTGTVGTADDPIEVTIGGMLTVGAGGVEAGPGHGFGTVSVSICGTTAGLDFLLSPLTPPGLIIYNHRFNSGGLFDQLARAQSVLSVEEVLQLNRLLLPTYTVETTDEEGETVWKKKKLRLGGLLLPTYTAGDIQPEPKNYVVSE